MKMGEGKESKEKERKLQEKFMEFQILQQQIAHVQKQIQQLSSQKDEIGNVQQSLSELSGTKVDSEILSPLCSGIFAKARLLDNKELLVNVGNNVVVKKKVPEVKGMLAKQEAEIRKMEEHLAEYLQKLAENGNKIEKELDGLIKEAKKNV